MEKNKEFQEFCNQMLKAVERRFPKETKIEIHKVLKNNSLELDSLVILKEKEIMSPNFYLQYYYEEYKSGVEVEILARQIEEVYYDALRSGEHLELNLSYEHCCDKVVFRLVSYERNQELLQSIPHIPFLDMVIIFYVLVRSDEDGIGSIRISNQIFNEWNLDTRELFALARENTMRMFPKKMCSMFSMMDRILEHGIGHRNQEYFGDLEMPKRCIPKEPYVITNSNGINGAAVLLYTNTLKEIGSFLGEDYFLLPSSIHEWLAVPVSAAIRVEDLYEMVWEVNASCVAKEEILSESVYHYDRKLEEIKICK